MSTWANTLKVLPRTLLLGTTFALLLVCMFAMPAFAAAWDVNDAAGCSDATGSPSYCHIQAAIDKSAPGDTIKVHPGTYAENLVIAKHIKTCGRRLGQRSRIEYRAAAPKRHCRHDHRLG